MGESRDAVKAASEIGRDHDGKVCPEQAIDISVIAVTFRGAAPRVIRTDGCAFGPPTSKARPQTRADRLISRPTR